MDKVIFNMATIPSRIYTMIATVKTILPQCDELNIYLNDFDDITLKYLHHDRKINYFKSQDNAGDLGDVGKFYMWPHKKDCYFFTCDDKFIYPADYVKKHIDIIEKYNRKMVVSLHGRIFNEGKCNSYYYHCKDFLGCLGHVPYDTWAHEIGTGVMAFHTDTLKPDMSIFKHTNMTDIYFSLHCQNLGIPMMVRKHAANYFKVILKHSNGQSISQTWNKKDGLMTDVVNSITWKLMKL